MSDITREYIVIISNKATEMMTQHFRLLANVSIPATKRLRATLYQAISSLANNPQRCPVFNTKQAKKSYLRLIAGRYQIIFSIDENRRTVNVQYILDSRQNSDI